LNGRAIARQDTPTSPTVVVVNKTFANDAFPKGTNPIGKRIGYGGHDSPLEFQIVGVVDDTPYESVRWKDHAMVFFPMLQRPASNKGPIDTDGSLFAGAIVVETSHPMPDMESIARETLSSINPNLAVVKFQTFDQQIADRFSDERMIARLTTLFGALALLLATIGLYGVTAYTVARQTSEIGIRMALGAGGTNVTSMILRDAATLATIGVVAGLVASYALSRLLETMLYGVSTHDPATFIGVTALIFMVALAASLVPALRASRVDPLRAMRAE
jgi:hypothetical protein